MTTAHKRVLGVDPGTFRMGVAVIEKDGSGHKSIFFDTLEADHKTLPERLHHLFNELSQVIKIYRPQVLAIENVFFSQNVQTAIKIGEARALALLAGAQAGLGIHEYPPARVKQSVVGNGRATKEQVQWMVRKLFNLKEAPPQDAADALAIALCYFHSSFQERLQKQSLRAPTLKVSQGTAARRVAEGRGNLMSEIAKLSSSRRRGSDFRLRGNDTARITGGR